MRAVRDLQPFIATLDLDGGRAWSGLVYRMTLHEQMTEELKRQVATGSLSSKKEAKAEAVLRRRRSERIREWLDRHAWLGGLAALFGLARFLPPPRNQPHALQEPMRLGVLLSVVCHPKLAGM
jgi:hypothetical protein